MHADWSSPLCIFSFLSFHVRHAAASPQDALVLLENIFASQCPAKSHFSTEPFPFCWEHLCFPWVFLLQVRAVCGGSYVLLVVKPACQCRRSKRHGSSPWVRMISWRKAWKPTPVFLPGESPWTEEHDGLRPWGDKKSDMTERVSRSTIKLHLVVTFPHHSSS